MLKAKEGVDLSTLDLESMTADELEDLLRDLNNEQAERRRSILGVHAVYDRKREAEQALAKLGNLSDSEIEALSTVIKTGGIKSRDEEEADDS